MSFGMAMPIPDGKHEGGAGIFKWAWESNIIAPPVTTKRH
jgi:hypothetical protein